MVCPPQNAIKTYSITMDKNWGWDILHIIDQYEFGFSENPAPNFSLWHGLNLTEVTEAYKVVRGLFPHDTIYVEREVQTECTADAEVIFSHEGV